VDEVTCDVVSLRECGMVLGSPYLYDCKAIFYRTNNQYQLTKAGQDYVVHAHHVKENKTLQTMEQLKKAVQASNKPIIVSNEVIDLKQEQEMIVEWKINQKLLQDRLMSCKYYKYVSSFAVVFLMLSLVMLSTWMIVASVRCNKVQMANNMLSVVMIVLQLILMRQVHRTEFRDRGQVGWPISSLLTGQ
jgi:ABC-type Na+ efflux pump permease subunit